MKNEISVNMTPNPLDYQTLHCSQNDTTLRKFKFTLHNQGEAVDTSSISDPVFSSFTEYEGGTEELLPTNTSTPSTSPILADIQYSDGLREDQSFTYRESPTTVSGNAKLRALYGNSIAWNQLCRTLTSGNWAIIGAGSGTLTFANGVATFTTTNNYGRFLYTPNNLVSGHKYLLSVEIKAYVNAAIHYALGSQTSYGSQGCICLIGNVQDANWHRYTSIGTFTSGTDDKVLVQNNSGASDLHEIQVRNIMYFDLTQMGLDSITSADEFTSIFSNSFYPYTTGTLLDFKGTGIKTVGFNQWDEELEQGFISTSNGLPVSSANYSRSKNFIPFLPQKSYYFKANYNVYVFYYDGNKNYLGFGSSSARNKVFTSPYSNAMYIKFRLDNGGADYENDICINISSSENGKYEPYTTSTTSLPISTYFPTGMKSAGSVYDELTSNKAITRVGQADLGTLTWTYSTTYQRFQSTSLSDSITRNPNTPNLLCSLYEPNNAVWSANTTDMIMSNNNSGMIAIRNLSYTNPTEFKSAMSGVMLNYELATPSEQSITSASLVTINGESDLYKDGEDLVCDCNEDISKESGYFDAKLRFTDADGTNYSNKFELHVERSPQ